MGELILLIVLTTADDPPVTDQLVAPWPVTDCEREALVLNRHWQYNGDRTVFKSVKYLCIPKTTEVSHKQ